MSTPQDITVSLEYAKKLKEAGWKDETYFYFFGTEERGYGDLVTQREMFQKRISPFFTLAAPTAEEILRRLPELIESVPHSPMHVFRMLGGGWRVMYDGTDHHGTADTLANAAAAMYCSLAEQKLLPLDHER